MKRFLIFVVCCSFLFMLGDTQKTVSYINLSDVSTAISSQNKGNEIKVAIIDTGVTSNDVCKSLNFSSDLESYDRFNHGTLVAKIIKYLAPNCELYSLKVFDESGFADTYTIVEALEFCLQNEIDVVNISLSYTREDELAESIVYELIARGTVVISSISNKNVDIDYPSMYKGVIAVGFTENPEKYGTDSLILFDESYVIYGDVFEESLKEAQGNSFLAPIATGVVTCLISDCENMIEDDSHDLVFLGATSVLKAFLSK